MHKFCYPAMLRRAGCKPPIPLPLPKAPIVPPPISSGYRQCSDDSKKKTKNTLVLDIDETLLHTFDYKNIPYDKIGTSPGFYDLQSNIDRYKKKSDICDKDWAVYYYFARPGLDEFLREMSELFEIVFWTAGTSEYCAALINSMERFHLSSFATENGLGVGNAVGTKIPKSIPYRGDIVNDMAKRMSVYGVDECHQMSKHCTKVYCPGHLLESNGKLTIKDLKDHHNNTNFYGLSRYQTLAMMNYMKYLPLLGRPLEKCVLIDDKVRSFKLTPRNAILVDPFDNPHKLTCFSDTTLAKITPMLRHVAKADNVMVELDHWREDGYEILDNFTLTCGKELGWERSTVHVADGHEVGALRSDLTRRDTPIPPYADVDGNSTFLDLVAEASKEKLKVLNC